MTVHTGEVQMKKSDSQANSTALGMQRNGTACKKEWTQIAMTAPTNAAVFRTVPEM
jgi:hypothetical protein